MLSQFVDNKMILMKSCFTVLFVALIVQASPLLAQMTWPKDPVMANARVNAKGDLEITASKSSSEHDFDFLTGKWTMDNKKLKVRLANNNDWEEFVSYDENMGSILDGIGNMDFYRATFDGQPFEGLTLRLFDREKRLWSLYWVDSKRGVLDPPVVGSFEGSIGKFFCKDVFRGKPVIVVFVWDKTDANNPVWSQAFSPDNGKTWEWNWTNTSHRVK